MNYFPRLFAQRAIMPDRCNAVALSCLILHPSPQHPIWHPHHSTAGHVGLRGESSKYLLFVQAKVESLTSK